MPSNTVKINNSDNLEWVVGDSRMDELIEWLEENGERLNIEQSDSCPAKSEEEKTEGAPADNTP